MSDKLVRVTRLEFCYAIDNYKGKVVVAHIKDSMIEYEDTYLGIILGRVDTSTLPNTYDLLEDLAPKKTPGIGDTEGPGVVVKQYDVDWD